MNGDPDYVAPDKFSALVAEWQREYIRVNGKEPAEISHKGTWFYIGQQGDSNAYRKSQLPGMIANLKSREDAKILGHVKQTTWGWFVSLPYLGKMIEWPVNPAQVAELDLEHGLEVRVNIKKPDAPFCFVKEVVEPYGHCAQCRKRFTFGERHLRVAVIMNGQSQGMPDQSKYLETNFHPHCLTPAIVNGICNAEIVNKKP